MEQLENHMILPRPIYRTSKEIEDYENYLLEQQDRNWEDIEC
jgi:hypothetical protein